MAQALNGEIINADSRQIYRGTRIGSGMPSHTDLALVPHHLYGFVDPAERYSAARFVEDARRVIDEIQSRGRLPVVAGGTGFYIEALAGSMPLDRPPPDEALRARLTAEAHTHAASVLWEWLAALDPGLARSVSPGDSYRIMRALEVALASRDVSKDAAVQPQARPSLSCTILTLQVARASLRERIARRVHGMFESGLLEEARALRSRCADAPALSGIGYAEALAFCDGLATHGEALAQTIHRTNAYAKRQETWFRRIRHALVVNADQAEHAVAVVTARARERLALA